MKLINRLFRITIVLTLLFSFTACEDNDDGFVKSTFSVDSDELTFAPSGGTKMFNTIGSLGVSWGVESEAEWLSFSKTEGIGTAQIDVEAAANDTENARSAIIRVFSHEMSYEIEATQGPSLTTIEPDANGMSTYTAVELTDIMGVGWNVGNSLDAVGSETAWGNPVINEKLIEAVENAGFNTVRIPIAWSNYIEEGDDTFTISNAGLARVEEVVNYVVSRDMFAMINIHWDGGWMQPTYADQDYVNDRLKKMWQQIAIYFRDYDYHLVFAGTNEVMVDGDYGTPKEEYYTVQNSFNQTFITTVRETGGKNAYRYLTVQGFNTNIDNTVKYAVLPEDTVENRMLMEVHYYDPYEFTLDVSNDTKWQWGAIATDPAATPDSGGEEWLDTQFQRMHDTFVSQGVGVILGEYGASYRKDVEGAEVYRAYYYEKTTQAALQYGLVPIIWDNGSPSNHQMGLFNRTDGSAYFPELIDALTNN